VHLSSDEMLLAVRYINVSGRGEAESTPGLLWSAVLEKAIDNTVGLKHYRE